MSTEATTQEAPLTLLKQHPGVIDASKMIGEAFIRAAAREDGRGFVATKLAFRAVVGLSCKALEGADLFAKNGGAPASSKWASPDRLTNARFGLAVDAQIAGERKAVKFIAWADGARRNRGFARVLIPAVEGGKDEVVSARLYMPEQETEEREIEEQGTSGPPAPEE